LSVDVIFRSYISFASLPSLANTFFSDAFLAARSIANLEANYYQIRHGLTHLIQTLLSS